MTPIEIGVTRSKVKVTVTISVKIVSDQQLLYELTDGLVLHIYIGLGQ